MLNRFKSQSSFKSKTRLVNIFASKIDYIFKDFLMSLIQFNVDSAISHIMVNA